jgi:hypothetical protein
MKFLILTFQWGLGIGDWGLGIGDWAQSPIPNPQSPIPNPQSPLKRSLIFYIFIYRLFIFKIMEIINNNCMKKSNKNIEQKNNNDLLGKIKSKYVLDIVLDYIKNRYKFILKLFLLSKKYQKKLGINLINYKTLFYDNNLLDKEELNKFLVYDKFYYINISEKEIISNLLKTIFDNYLSKSKINKNILQKIFFILY